ncbi:ArsI/CadI family heavy metal resistance metalloenzyme [Gloeobacter kilaueensis]|uniref:Glyoxalase/bleomycin resistance protein/dioxygenase n=1 Tax=Gloeobacter kilaueensis (strain ATCC BAA-2537 / CCAP 1431/1 / ULC 316 / JS1) TaxID=1183438 RepID=U5QH68_GLOK1|nr:ArsI/CadI family heavy metal resistance metalloenzyme [Gloeobacter kilaueensis]AGY58286.1 glyoxalase/bleomycin resistance protein/dioxygenase [Gloeobacter kilaueensis JS1]
MPFRPHISLDVADIDRSVRFYSTVFATEPTKHYPDYANFRLTAPALHLAVVLAPGREGRRTGGEHFGVEFLEASELAGWRERAEAAGLALRVEEAVTCCYAVADKFWLSDPDGHEWEFWLRLEEADSLATAAPQITSAAVCCAPACCE